MTELIEVQYLFYNMEKNIVTASFEQDVSDIIFFERDTMAISLWREKEILKKQKHSYAEAPQIMLHAPKNFLNERIKKPPFWCHED